jgi:hypothetical protein
LDVGNGLGSATTGHSERPVSGALTRRRPAQALRARLPRMSSWNYRVVRGADGLRIFDVYHDDAGQPVSTNVAPTYVYGETLDAPSDQLQPMREALARPILDDSDIGGGRAPRAEHV